ncbi:hypothetical protein GUJ93_ZPchr0002g23123 [Zizania palustris]|uniref:Exoribonuclease phosphorolytic domain-containing protein n=1 Tax=Zizania palustris TaxID=103762 RepID=A0A8J5RT47_ZIZPA|nr:hypothetical protein GUJ93_ZPchr0002g23123 [Zizania palustris]
MPCRGWKCGCLPRLEKEGMGWWCDYSSMARNHRACSSQRCLTVIIWHAVVEMATISTTEKPLLVSTIKGNKVERPLLILQMRQPKGEIGIIAKEDGSVLFEMGNTRVITVVYGPQEVSHLSEILILCIKGKQFEADKKQGDMSITDYCRRLKTLADALRDVATASNTTTDPSISAIWDDEDVVRPQLRAIRAPNRDDGPVVASPSEASPPSAGPEQTGTPAGSEQAGVFPHQARAPTPQGRQAATFPHQAGAHFTGSAQSRPPAGMSPGPSIRSSRLDLDATSLQPVAGGDSHQVLNSSGPHRWLAHNRMIPVELSLFTR